MFRLPPLTPLVRALLITLVALFVACAILENFAQIPVLDYLMLETRRVSVWTLPQLLTHVWILPPAPGAVFWLALSCYFLWLIVAPFEGRYGQRRVIELVAVAALSAGIPALLVGQLLPRFAGPIAGPHSITLCALSAYAVLLPPYADVSFFGVMLRPKHLLWFLLGLSFIGFVTSKNASSLASDVGAIVGGIAFVKYWMQRPPPRKSAKRGRLRVVRTDDDSPKRWLN